MKTSTLFSLFTSVVYYSISVARAQDVQPTNITGIVVDNAVADGIDLFALDDAIINGALSEMESVYEQVATVEGETGTERKRSLLSLSVWT